MNPLLNKALGSIVRHFLTLLSGILVAKGIWQIDDQTGYVVALADWAVSLLPFLVAQLWSWWEKRQSQTKLATSLALGPMTEAQLNRKIADGVTADPTTPVNVQPSANIQR